MKEKGCIPESQKETSAIWSSVQMSKTFLDSRCVSSFFHVSTSSHCAFSLNFTNFQSYSALCGSHTIECSQNFNLPPHLSNQVNYYVVIRCCPLTVPPGTPLHSFTRISGAPFWLSTGDPAPVPVSVWVPSPIFGLQPSTLGSLCLGQDPWIHSVFSLLLLLTRPTNQPLILTHHLKCGELVMIIITGQYPQDLWVDLGPSWCLASHCRGAASTFIPWHFDVNGQCTNFQHPFLAFDWTVNVMVAIEHMRKKGRLS